MKVAYSAGQKGDVKSSVILTHTFYDIEDDKDNMYNLLVDLLEMNYSLQKVFWPFYISLYVSYGDSLNLMPQTLFATSSRKFLPSLSIALMTIGRRGVRNRLTILDVNHAEIYCELQSSLRRINGLRQSEETKAQEGDNASGHNPMILIPLRSCNFFILAGLTTRWVGTITSPDRTTWPSPKTTISADGLPMPC